MDAVGMKYAGKSYNELRLVKEPRKSMRYNFKNFFPEHEEEAYQDYLEGLESTLKDTQLFPSSREFLETCKANNIPMINENS